MSGRGLESLVSHLHSHQDCDIALLKLHIVGATFANRYWKSCASLQRSFDLSGFDRQLVSQHDSDPESTLTPTRRGVQRQPTRLASDHFARRKLTDKSHHHRNGSDVQAYEVDAVPRPSYGALRAWLRTFVCPRSRSFPRAALTGRQIPKGPKHNNSIAPHLRSKHVGDDVICHLQRSKTARASHMLRTFEYDPSLY